MRIPRKFSLLLAILVTDCLPVDAQVVAHTEPRGYYTVKVPGVSAPGTTTRTYLGIQLLPDSRFTGLVQGVDANTVDFVKLVTEDYTNLADPLRPSYLHVLDGSGKGFVTDIVQFTTNGVICADNPVPWIQPGTRVLVRPHSNLADILGATNRFGLAAGADAESADNLVVWDSVTQQERIYYFHSIRNRWETKGVVADASGASLRFPNGFYLVRRSSGTLRIALSGNIGSESVLLPVRPGAGVFSLPVNLSGSLDAIVRTSGDFRVHSGPNANSADILTFEEPTTGQQRGPFYYLNRAGVAGWREIGVDGSQAANQPLDFLSTLVFRRRGGPGFVLAEGNLAPPAVPRPPLPPDPEPGELPLTAEFPLKQAMPPDVTLMIETSTDLQAWTSHASPTLTEDHRLVFPLPSGQSRAFYRLAVTYNF
jgi:hypothetical protein